jgi:hypothetical protein
MDHSEGLQYVRQPGAGFSVNRFAVVYRNCHDQSGVPLKSAPRASMTAMKSTSYASEVLLSIFEDDHEPILSLENNRRRANRRHVRSPSPSISRRCAPGPELGDHSPVDAGGIGGSAARLRMSAVVSGHLCRDPISGCDRGGWPEINNRRQKIDLPSTLISANFSSSTPA